MLSCSRLSKFAKKAESQNLSKFHQKGERKRKGMREKAEEEVMG
jgi:hypothetical protein